MQLIVVIYQIMSMFLRHSGKACSILEFLGLGISIF